MSDSRLIIKKQVIPVIPLRGMLVFPFMLMHFDAVSYTHLDVYKRQYQTDR